MYLCSTFALLRMLPFSILFFLLMAQFKSSFLSEKVLVHQVLTAPFAVQFST